MYIIKSGAERAIILAALRSLQQTGIQNPMLEDIATNGGEHGIMSDVEIDGLCERINCAAKVTFQDIDALAREHDILITDWLDQEMMMDIFPDMRPEDVPAVLRHVSVGDYDNAIDRDITRNVIGAAAKTADVGLYGETVVDLAVDRVLDQYRQNLSNVCFENRGRIKHLVAEVEPAGKAVASFFADQLDNLQASLGAKAANDLEDADGQEQAITACEEWVSNNVKAAGVDTCIAAILEANGVEEGTKMIRNAIAGVAA